MSQPRDREDEIILDVLEGDPLMAGIGSEGELRREYVEVLGLLPHALTPVTPSARVRSALLAAVSESRPAVAEPAGVVRPFVSPVATAEIERGAGRWQTWGRIAAVLAVLTVAASAWLYGRWSDAESRAEALAERVAELESSAVELADLRERFAHAASTLSLITDRGSSACPLRPMDEASPQPVARGVLYIGPDHQHWYLKLSGLDAVDETRTYQLWFRTAEGDVPFQSFRTAAGAEVELGSPTMPDGTEAVIITIEPVDGSPEPTGPVVLYGDERMDLA